MGPPLRPTRLTPTTGVKGLERVSQIRGSVRLKTHWTEVIVSRGPSDPGAFVDCSRFQCQTFDFTCFRLDRNRCSLGLPRQCTTFALRNVQHKRHLSDLSAVLTQVKSLTLSIPPYDVGDAQCFDFLMALSAYAPHLETFDVLAARMSSLIGCVTLGPTV